MQDNLKDSMIANLTENRFLQQVQLVPFGFSLILRDAFMLCPPPKVWRGWIFFPKMFLIEGQILWGKVIGGGGGVNIRRGTYEQIIPRGNEFCKMNFPVI